MCVETLCTAVTGKNEMCKKSGNGYLLCIEAVDVQYSHLLDYCAFPGFTRSCEREEETWWTGSVLCFRKGTFKPDRCTLDPAPSQPAVSPSTARRDLNRPDVSPQHFPAEFLHVTQKQHRTSKHMIKAR